MKKKSPHRPPAASTEMATTLPNVGIRWLAATIFAIALAVAAWLWLDAEPKKEGAAFRRPATAATHRFVGTAVCAGCHDREYADWRDSQHAKAMQHATAATVLGNFDNARFDYHGVVSTFFKRDGKFFVNTDGADGKLSDFRVDYAFGVYPLQQYLVSFPGGRLQALPIAWDARPAAQGGGRWFHLYPAERIAHGDPLHWTGPNQNWNWMCADCHTTNLGRNYDASSNTYATRWSEMDVACEACHGPAADHVAWARSRQAASTGGSGLAVEARLTVALDERKGLHWLPVPATGNAIRSKVLETHRELTACAQCHSRRSPLAEGMDHDGRFLDTHEIALLDEGRYFDDGQQREEVYTIGSFLQSKMHARGVTCSDCHNPHSGKLRLAGNAVCEQCHSAAKYDVRAHTLHAPDSVGAQCTACHMPTRTYMGVDPRHDHSFRIPRPDLSASLQTPNACNGCHEDRNAGWAARIIEQAFGKSRMSFQTFGPALHAARIDAPGATPALIALLGDRQVPAIARATALSALAPRLSQAAMPALEASLADKDAMVRAAALETLLAAPPDERVRLAARLIDDPSRIVRIKAARALAVANEAQVPAPMRARLDGLFAEYVASQRANADRAEVHVNLALFFSERGDAPAAEGEYRAAIALQPGFVPAYVNLADFYRASGRDPEAESVLASGLRRMPADADLLHSLGLLRVRQGRMADALPLLAGAHDRAPDNSRYAYVYGVVLHDSGRRAPAIAVLESALARAPGNIDLLSALAGYAREAGDDRRAQAYARRLDASERADGR